MQEGIDLKSIREKKGLTIDKVFEDTKIPKRVLVALESKDFSDLFLNPVYIRGFAKTYARYLGLDPEEVVRSLFPEEKGGAKVDKKDAKVEINNNRKDRLISYLHTGFRWLKEGIIFIISIGISFLVKVPKRVYIWSGILILAFLLVLSIGHREVGEEKSFGKVDKEIKKGSEPSQKTDVDSLLSSESRKDLSEVKKEEPRREKFSILVRATDDCWLRVKADGEELFRGVLKKGDVENWSGKKEISLWVGNAGALRITCDGKSYTNIGRRGQVIRDIVFQSDCSYYIRRH